ncbi:hypothetical protein CONLIGDRAFT_654897 [Coniochaeta ligniaria NRRL 30616]|uniref:Oxidase ustYa n=1 Tax=Coniochaeta ligniaria NRRL 30616 TaxID=1408157 RepID=A0A1J7JM54_9PEZI|nr:hypothetical protein CONLIGDRAFT_654897 [Coniochaeta ligniaria NRRL 30616]
MSRSASVQDYRGVRTADYEDHDDAATEVGDSLPGTDEEKCWDQKHHHEQSQQRSGMRRLCEIAFSLRSLLDTLLLLVIVGLLLERRLSQHEPPSQERPGQLESLGDITGFAPRISQQIKTFKPDFSYAPEDASKFFTPEVQNKWLDLVPRGLGYVEVPHPETHNNLPKPLDGYSATVFTTAMTHQLHCLYAIVEVYSGMASNNTDKVPKETPWHLNHCFEYLRQSIMCCGDTALEGQATTFPSGVTGSDGWDATHVCRNYDQVYEYLEESRANDDVWI